VLLLMANAGLLRRTTDHAPDAWRRLVGFTLDGLGATSARTTVPSQGERAIRAAMASAGQSLGCAAQPAAVEGAL
jgi:hypothetical protein